MSSFKSWIKSAQTSTSTSTRLALGVVLLAVCNLISLSMALGNHERIVLVPPHMNEEMEIGWNSADADYNKSFGLYVAILLGNVNPQNAEFVADASSKLFTPNLYRQLREGLFKGVEQIKTSGNALSFEPRSIQYEAKSKKTFVLGKQRSRGLQGGEEERDYVYEFEAVVDEGLPRIGFYDHYEGAPHLEQWRNQMDAREEAEANKPKVKPKQGNVQ